MQYVALVFSLTVHLVGNEEAGSETVCRMLTVRSAFSACYSLDIILALLVHGSAQGRI